MLRCTIFVQCILLCGSDTQVCPLHFTIALKFTQFPFRLSTTNSCSYGLGAYNLTSLFLVHPASEHLLIPACPDRSSTWRGTVHLCAPGCCSVLGLARQGAGSCSPDNASCWLACCSQVETAPWKAWPSPSCHWHCCAAQVPAGEPWVCWGVLWLLGWLGDGQWNCAGWGREAQ